MIIAVQNTSRHRLQLFSKISEWINYYGLANFLIAFYFPCVFPLPMLIFMCRSKDS